MSIYLIIRANTLYVIIYLFCSFSANDTAAAKWVEKSEITAKKLLMCSPNYFLEIVSECDWSFVVDHMHTNKLLTIEGKERVGVEGVMVILLFTSLFSTANRDHLREIHGQCLIQ